MTSSHHPGVWRDRTDRRGVTRPMATRGLALASSLIPAGAQRPADPRLNRAFLIGLTRPYSERGQI